MQAYEYTVIPAPARGEKVRGARTGVERFSYTLTMEINRMAANGWEYVRAETLPCEERSGLTSRTTVYHNVLVFRRALAAQPAYQPVYEEPAVASPPVAEPAANWPDGESVAATPETDVDNYDDPGVAASDEPPAFIRRPPLAAAREADSAPAGNRLGPAER